jgi:hypothetical protein
MEFKLGVSRARLIRRPIGVPFGVQKGAGECKYDNSVFDRPDKYLKPARGVNAGIFITVSFG